MECSCEISTDFSFDFVYENYNSEIKISKNPSRCGECERFILIGEEYEKASGEFDGEKYQHTTCLDCVSLRNHFFDDWQFETLWETFSNYMDDCGWEVPEKCLSKVTPATRTRICEMTEEYWEEEDEE